MTNSINIRTFSDFITAKHSRVFANLKEGDELIITWGPLVKCVMLELFILYENNGLRPYILYCNSAWIAVSFVEEP